MKRIGIVFATLHWSIDHNIRLNWIKYNFKVLNINTDREHYLLLSKGPVDINFNTIAILGKFAPVKIQTTNPRKASVLPMS